MTISHTIVYGSVHTDIITSVFMGYMIDMTNPFDGPLMIHYDLLTYNEFIKILLDRRSKAILTIKNLHQLNQKEPKHV